MVLKFTIGATKVFAGNKELVLASSMPTNIPKVLTGRYVGDGMYPKTIEFNIPNVQFVAINTVNDGSRSIWMVRDGGGSIIWTYLDMNVLEWGDTYISFRDEMNHNNDQYVWFAIAT